MPASKIHDIGTQVFGFILSAITSYTLMEDIAVKSLIAICTGFVGGFAALGGKMILKWLVDKIKK